MRGTYTVRCRPDGVTVTYMADRAPGADWPGCELISDREPFLLALERIAHHAQTLRENDTDD